MRLQNVISLNMALQPCCGGNVEVMHGTAYDSFDNGCSTDNVISTKKVSPYIFLSCRAPGDFCYGHRHILSSNVIGSITIVATDRKVLHQHQNLRSVSQSTEAAVRQQQPLGRWEYSGWPIIQSRPNCLCQARWQQIFIKPKTVFISTPGEEIHDVSINQFTDLVSPPTIVSEGNLPLTDSREDQSINCKKKNKNESL